MRKGLIVGLGAALAVGAVSVADASACGRRVVGDCGRYVPPAAYAPPAYGYLPPARAYGYGPPPAAYYAPPPAPGYYGAGYNGGYGYRGVRGCDRGYGYAPRVYDDDDDDDDYMPAGAWAPVR